MPADKSALLSPPESQTTQNVSFNLHNSLSHRDMKINVALFLWFRNIYLYFILPLGLKFLIAVDEKKLSLI